MLGPVELWSGGNSVDLGPPKQRTVFAALVVDAGRVVPVDTLVSRVWDDDPPAEARNALYAHLMRIRRALASVALRLDRGPGGYVLRIDPECVDVLRFRKLVSGALGARFSDDERADMLDEALRLWRGIPFSGLSGSWVDRIRDGYQQQYLDAVTAWGRVQLRLGDHESVIHRLHQEVAEHPLVEPLVAVLMQALHAAGRDQEALDRYRTIRRRLVEEFGADPGAELQTLHQAILRGVPVVATAPAPSPQVHRDGVPRQLPPAVPDFVGRMKEAAEIRAWLRGSETVPPALVVVSGMGGVGKTALAVTVARGCRDHFPDGQLYIELRETADTHAVLGSFLRALGVPARSVPYDADERVGLYRTVTAERRLLVVLDNAANETDVRPLLPGGVDCGVIVTTRSLLQGLDGAKLVPLAELSTQEGVELLTLVAGPERVAAAPHLEREIVRLCGGLPLALRIAAVRLASGTIPDIGQLVQLLDDERGRLDALRAGDRSVRASLAISYRGLGHSARRLLRLLGSTPGPDIGLDAASVLASSSTVDVRGELDRLTDVHLVAVRPGQRFALHDLVRAFAVEQALADGPAATDAGVRTLLRWYIAACAAVGDVLTPGRVDLDEALESPPGPLPTITDAAAAAEWFAAERDTLLEAARYALDRGWYTEAWQLAYVQRGGLVARHEVDTWIQVSQWGLAAAQAVADKAAEGRIRGSLGSALLLARRYTEAIDNWLISAGLHIALGEPVRLGKDYDSMAYAYTELGDLDRAEYHQLRAVDIPEYADSPAYGSFARVNLGSLYGDQGRYDEALVEFRRGLELATAAGDLSMMCIAHHDLAEVLVKLGRPAEAVPHAEAEIEVARSVPFPLREARGWDVLADALATTDPARAENARRQAQRIYQAINDPRAEKQ